MNDFSDGLRLDRLHPPQIVDFLQGFARRLHDRLEAIDEEEADQPSAVDEQMNTITGALRSGIHRLTELGYALDTTVEDYTPAHIVDGTPAGRVAAAAVELARRVSGVPNRAWEEHNDVLDALREDCSLAARELRAIGQAPD